MISLAPSARIVGTYSSKMDRVGKGMLYVLSSGIMFEAQGRRGWQSEDMPRQKVL